MNTTIATGSPKAAGLVGSIISVALVFGGSVAVAEGLTGFGSPGSELAGLYGTFSDSDIAQLEQATRAETTAVKMAELAADAPTADARPMRSMSATVAAAPASDLFPYSGRVLPLLVPQSDAVARAPATVRPGLTRPVGVPYSLLRSRTPTEHTAR